MVRKNLKPTVIYTCPDYSYIGVCTRGDYAVWLKIAGIKREYIVVHRSNDLPALMGDPIHILERFFDRESAIAALGRWQQVRQPWVKRPYIPEEVERFFQRHKKAGLTMWQFLMLGKAMAKIREAIRVSHPKGRKAKELQELFDADIPINPADL